MTKRSTLLTFLLVSLANVVWGQEPSATLEPTGATAFCQSGIANIKVTFIGSGPFGYALKATKVSAPSSYETIIRNTDSAIYPDESGNAYIEYPVTESTAYELIEVYDQNTPRVNNKWVYGSGSTNVSGTATFQIDQMPVTNAGTDQSNVCGYSTSLAAAPQFADSEIFWDIPSIGSLSATNSAAPTFTAPYEGSFILTFNEKRGACTDQDQVTVTLLGSPKGKLSGQNEICQTGNLQAQLILEGQSPWSFTAASGEEQISKSNITNTTYNFIILANGTQTYQLSEVTDGNGCKATAEDMSGSAKAIDIKPNVFAGNDKTVCGSLTSLLEGTTDKGTVSWTSVPAANIASPSALTSNSTATSYGYVEYTLTANFNGCLASDKTTYLFAQLPNLTNAATDKTIICAGTSVNLNLATDAQGAWTLKYTENGTAKTFLLDNKTETIALAPTVTTLYEFIELTDSYGCTHPNLNKSQTVTVEQVETANAGPDQALDKEYTTNLGATPPISAVGEWLLLSGTGVVEKIHYADTPVKQLSVGNNVFRWTLTPEVCPSTFDDVVVAVNRYTTYNGFSPNGDGVNDYFIIDGAYTELENELLVFTPKGKLVYKKNNYQNNWNGEGMDGKPLESGTYYYVFTSKNQLPVKDYLVIRR